MTLATRPPQVSAPQPAPPPAPRGELPSAAGRTRRRPRRFTRSVQIRVAMVVTALAIVFFAVSVHQAVTDAQKTVTAVGQDDTAGIQAAQRIKSDLAEMDLITTQELLKPTADKGSLPDAYVRKHKELVTDLDVASQQITLGTAETVPLANLEYERAQYQALVRDAILADQDGDRSKALSLQQQAHEVMAGSLGLQEQADAFDKANTYALNQSYANHKSSSASSGRMLLLSGFGLLAVLLVIQLWHVLGFHRLFNLGLASATLVGAGVFLFSTARISSSDQHLTEAREHAFDPVHELWQARAAAYLARQAEAQALLDPSRADAAETVYQQASGRLYRVPDATTNIAESAKNFRVPTGVGGYLANELRNQSISAAASAATKDTLTRFGDYDAAHQAVRAAASSGKTDRAVTSFLAQGPGDNGYAFTQLVTAIYKTLSLNETAFTANADAAAHALAGVDVLNAVAALVLLGLVMWGLSQRLREYTGT